MAESGTGQGAGAPADALGRDIIDRLRSGKLPRMVDWFDPGLLAKVGVRSVISATLGSYTDQRLIQASTDNASLERLQNRYNFSGEGVITDRDTPRPSEALEAAPDGAVWIDYIADLGDGFEATYAMAYLLAAEELKVAGEAAPLPAGRLLVMGGDQVYPDATKQEYSARLRDPYDWAFATAEPKRKLFAIPGNHDWYDGLSAFSALFCSSRDRISRGVGSQIGGWRCHQHRSYFALRLPHNWWIWGPDIQLADNLDDSQRDYFDLMAEQTSEKDNIILCLAEPSWLHKNYDNMHEISMLARKNGAKICAVIAGDWHHYSRYTSDKLGIQFITAGGGGAFAHATHGLKKHVDLRWATPTGASKVVASQEDSAEFNRIERAAMGAQGRDFTQARSQVPAVVAHDQAAGQVATTDAPAKDAAQVAVAPEPKPATDTDAGPAGMGNRAKAVRKEEIKSASYDCSAMHIYPPQWKSRLLCLKNLALPFRNRPFTYLVGIVYFIYAWAFVAADPNQSPFTRKMVDSIGIELSSALDEVQTIDKQILELQTRMKLLEAPENQANPALRQILADEAVKLRQLEGTREIKQTVVTVIQKRKAVVEGATATKLTGDLQTRMQDITNNSTLGLGGKLMALGGALLGASLAQTFDIKALKDAAELSPIFAFMLLGLWAGLMGYVESESKLVKFIIGTIHAAAHITALLVISWLAQVTGILPRSIGALFGVADDVSRIFWNIVVTLFVGGLLGGFVMGLYWTLTSTLLNMHTGDAFGALGIKDYKNFLRIKLEPNRATIYPIALDTVPGPKGWRWQLKPGEQRPSHNPRILPVSSLEPRLIEKAPIVIEAHKVRP